jgi:aspartate racemase
VRSTLGVVGGLGPEGTVHYYRRIAARLGALPLDEHRPGLVVDHVWSDRFVALHRVGADAAVIALLADSLARLHRAGADVALVAAVAPHRFLPSLRRSSPLPIIDLVEATLNELVRAHHTRVALLGTRATLTENFFRRRLEQAGIQVSIPAPAEIDWLDDLIAGPLAAGQRTPATRRELQAILRRLEARGKLDAVVVACADLLELLDPALPLVDPVECHVALAVASARTNLNG